MLQWFTMTSTSTLPRTGKSELRFQLLSRTDELQGFAADWENLHEHCAYSTPFLTPSWMMSWWQIYGASSGRQLCIGLFFDDEKLIGIAPLCKRRIWYRPGIPFMRIEPLGSDFDEPDGVCSEFLNLIAREGYEERVFQAFAHGLAEGRFGTWEELFVPAMNGDDARTNLLLESLRGAGLNVESSSTQIAVYLDLPSSWEDYLSSLPSKQRYPLRMYQRRFLEWAGGDVKLFTATTADELEKGMHILKRLHQERWESDGGSGVFSFPRFDQFHSTYSLLALQEGRLQLNWLTVRDEPVAAIYNLVEKDRVYFYQSGRKMDVPASVRLGMVQIIYALQEAIRQRARVFEFLGGDDHYTLKFSKTSRPLVQIRASRWGIKEAIRICADRGRDIARRLRTRLQRTKHET